MAPPRKIGKGPKATLERIISRQQQQQQTKRTRGELKKLIRKNPENKV